MTNYIERYWRDAKPEDAIKEPPMVARFCDRETSNWGSPYRLTGWDRAGDLLWSSGSCFWKFCQVYDAPDPGEGWRLIDPDSEWPEEGDEFYLPYTNEWAYCNEFLSAVRYTGNQAVRRRITPAVKYVPFTWEDREELRGRVIVMTWPSGMVQEFSAHHFTKKNNKEFEVAKVEAESLLRFGKFLDTGEPVGKKVTQ